MADTILDGPVPPDATAGTSTPRRTYYDCGGGRKTFFSLLFILLLPFFISTPVMIYQRVAKGVWLDTWGLIVIAVVFAALMLLILFELMFSLRAYVDIGTEAVSFTLPVRGGGVVPLFFYSARRIPYDEINAVETRREVFKSSVTPMMLRTVRLNLKTGERLLLGYTNEADDDPKFPFPEIGRQIADRAGVRYVDRGNVLTELHKKMFGLAHAQRNSEEAEIVELNRQHNRFLVTLIVGLGVLLAAGIASDIWNESQDAGEQARTEVQQRTPAKRR